MINGYGRDNSFYGKTHTEETKAKMRLAHARRKALGTYKPHTEETKRKISEATKGRVAYNKGKLKGKYKTCDCGSSFYVKISDLTRRRFCSRKCLADFNAIRMTGSGSPCWKGGISPINKVIRASRSYKEWRKAVFNRDDYTCQNCGIRGGYVEADHVKPFAIYPELRFDLSNGRTLCLDCHKLTDTYKGRTLHGHRV